METGGGQPGALALLLSPDKGPATNLIELDAPDSTIGAWRLSDRAAARSGGYFFRTERASARRSQGFALPRNRANQRASHQICEVSL